MRESKYRFCGQEVLNAVRKVESITNGSDKTSYFYSFESIFGGCCMEKRTLQDSKRKDTAEDNCIQSIFTETYIHPITTLNKKKKGIGKQYL